MLTRSRALNGPDKDGSIEAFVREMIVQITGMDPTTLKFCIFVHVPSLGSNNLFKHKEFCVPVVDPHVPIFQSDIQLVHTVVGPTRRPHLLTFHVCISSSSSSR